MEEPIKSNQIAKEDFLLQEIFQESPTRYHGFEDVSHMGQSTLLELPE